MIKNQAAYQTPAVALVRVNPRIALQASVTTPIEPLTPVEYEDDGFWS